MGDLRELVQEELPHEGASHAKILKIFRKAYPHIHWIRRKKADDVKNGIFAYAGLIGKQGIQFGINPTWPEIIILRHAREIATRLIRGEPTKDQ